jgi:hypothetical protein
VAHPQIATFARLAGENSQPKRVIYGQKTLMSRTMHDIRYDAVHDEFLVTNPFALAVLVFRGGANGEEAPIRIIQGPHTQLGGSDRLEVDPINDEILVPEGDKILVFPRTAQGDVAPIRVLEGPDTLLSYAESVVVDPVHNLMFVGTQDRRGTLGGGALMSYSRTANGNIKPKTVVRGGKAGIVRINQMDSYPPKGWVIATMPGRQDVREPEGVFVGIWNITDNGDVAPRWKINGPKTGLLKPRGVVLDPAHKEVIISDMRLNSVLTFYYPEIF